MQTSDFDTINAFEDEFAGDRNTDNEQTRHGHAIVHHKLFPKYGFLIPEIPLYHGETIFFGLTAHENASKKFIADLRDELHAGQRVEFLAVATEREGTVRWKAIIVTPLDDDSLNNNELKADGIVNQMWLECSVHQNLCPTHGFATPINGNPYYDNVYFTLREASAGLEKSVTDLTEEFNPGDPIRALVVPADSKFRAKYQAVMICRSKKTSSTSESSQIAGSNSSINTNKNALNIDAGDIPVVMAICDTLLSKEEDDGVKITSLAGDIGSNSEARAAVLPQKKALKRFLAKYPQYFLVKEDTVHSGSNVSIKELKLKLEAKKNEDMNKKEIEEVALEKNNNGQASDPPMVNENEDTNISNNQERSASDVFAVFQSEQGVKLLADILIKYGRAMKIGDLLRSCQQQGWTGMKTTAMLTQLIQKKKSIFGIDDSGHVFITDEGKRQITFGTKKKEELLPNKEKPAIGSEKNLNLKNEFPTPYESMLLRLSQPNSSFPQAELTQSEMLGGGNHASSVFSSNSHLAVGPRPRTTFTTTIPSPVVGSALPSSSGGARKSYNSILPGGDFFRTNNDNLKSNDSLTFPKLNPSDFVSEIPLSQAIFPNGDMNPSKVSPFGVIGDTYLNNIYDSSDNETTTSSQYGSSSGFLVSKFSLCSPEELQYLQVVSRAIFCQQNNFTHKLGMEKDYVNELLQLLKKELENLGVVSTDMEEHSLKGILSKHLICIHLDEGLKPRAKFQYFTPSGAIQQSTVTLGAECVTWVALNSMIHNENADIVNVVFESFYGIKNTLHWIRFLPSIDKQLVGCTVKFNKSTANDVRLSDQIRLGDGNKLKVILSEKGTTSSSANSSLRKYTQDKNETMSVYVIDMEAQILGFKKYDMQVRRSICNDLTSQQKFLENAVHFCPDYVIVNAVDTKTTLKIIKRLIDNNVRVLAEVYRPLEKILYGLFGRPS